MRDELPLGFGLALAGNPWAMQVFSSLDGESKKKILAETRKIRSKEEMRQFVQSIADDRYGAEP